MTTEANSSVIRHWEDVVFENRNKDYGAYLLRKAYAQRLMTGLGVTMVLVTILLSMQNFRPKGQIMKEIPIPLGTTVEPLPPPSIKPRPPRNPVQRPPARSTNTQILVTTQEVEETEVEAITDFVSTEGDDIGGVGTIEGTGTIPIEIPAAVALPEIVDHAEIRPEYEGGMEAMMKFIQKKIRYPRTAIRQEIEGTVFVRFVVRPDGSVTDVQLVRGIHPDCDKEAMRVVSLLPSWRGGSHNGRPVSVRMVLPIKFNLHQ